MLKPFEWNNGELYSGVVRMTPPELTVQAHRASPITNCYLKKEKIETGFHQASWQEIEG